jgi:hypothetical protein
MMAAWPWRQQAHLEECAMPEQKGGLRRREAEADTARRRRKKACVTGREGRRRKQSACVWWFMRLRLREETVESWMDKVG